MKFDNLKNENLYYIGGIVRDMILKKECSDIDITFVGNAIEYAKTIENAKIIKINKPFGTVKILIDEQEIDLASTRNETYPHPGHLPQVTEIGCSLKKDVLRRDFTINTLAKSINTGEIIDYLNGNEDIKNKLIRVIHDKSFIDDPTRIIRGLKFAVRFGFELEEHTKKLQNEYLNNINYDMSYKRIKKELIETFNLNKQKAFEEFFKQNIYKLITKKDIKVPKYDIQSLIAKYPVKDTWLAYLGWMDLSLLPLTKRESKVIEDFNRLKKAELNNDYEIYNEFGKSEKESIILYAITMDDKKVFKYFDKLVNIKVELTGNDLQELGIKPSKEYSECFEYILKEKIKSPDINELKLAKKFFKLD